MKRVNGWMVWIWIVVVFLLAACGAAPKAEKVKPVELKKIEGSEFSQVVLTQKAVERIGLTTEPVRAAMVKHMQTVPGEVVDPQAAPAIYRPDAGKVLVRGYVNPNDLGQFDRQQTVLVQPLDDENAAGFPAEQINDLEETDENGDILYFLAGNEGGSLEPGQRVFVEIALQGNGSQQLVIPYAAVIYGLKGETWVYVNPEPLVFVRQPVVVNFIDEGMAVLKEGQGPSAGTPVVTVGVQELYGAETGVSK